MDLLDRIFELDEQKRIDVRSIKMHPWFRCGKVWRFEERGGRWHPWFRCGGGKQK